MNWKIVTPYGIAFAKTYRLAVRIHVALGGYIVELKGV